MAIYGGQIQYGLYQAPDYGPSVAAAREYAMSNAQIIPNLIGKYQEQKKENSQINALKKSAINQIDSAISLFGDKVPGIKEQLEMQKAAITDPKISNYEQGLMAQQAADSIQSSLNMFLKAGQVDMMQLRQQKAMQSMGGGEGGDASGIVF